MLDYVCPLWYPHQSKYPSNNYDSVYSKAGLAMHLVREVYEGLLLQSVAFSLQERIVRKKYAMTVSVKISSKLLSKSVKFYLMSVKYSTKHIE